jgi:hydrogenase maturation protein HypF
MERRAITVQGIVQGVGFRPFVFSLASRFDLRGFVRNRTGDVLIEVEGETGALDGFQEELVSRPPPLARIDGVRCERLHPKGAEGFFIEQSDDAAAGSVFISPDVATCAACLAELFDPTDRHYGYPFLNCTNCGPRLTIVTGAPYDRERTTMAGFPMCAACRAEYDDRANRRFHAQPTACPACGPKLHLLDEAGRLKESASPLEAFATDLHAGRIGALKGLGGFHLACDARSEIAVGGLRRRKHRDEKPFAIMVPDVAAARSLCQVDAVEEELLASVRRPIVLLRRLPAATVAHSVAPGNPFLGVMLPYTPLHHLLLHEVAGMPLVMTSGNQSDEPIAYEDDAPQKLSGIADVYLTHERPIQVRCDDSVTRVLDGEELPLRRSRGYAPAPISLPFGCPRPLLAVGGQLKATFALGRGRQAFLSHHMGDLDHFEAYRAYIRDIALYQQLFATRPQCLVHDLHPDYASTRFAKERAEREGIEVLAVQHHHAHMAACMAEHGLAGPVIGVTFDGTGFGTDGTVWGGEFLVGDFRQFRRAAYLRPVGMPGGDQAIRQPWRMALAHLRDAEVSCPPLGARLQHAEMRMIEKMLERGLNTPLTSSAGRLFDAVSSLAGVRDRTSYEGQAAIELEWLATDTQAEGVYPFDLVPDDNGAWVIDTRPLIRAVAAAAAAGEKAAVLARRFHATLVELVAAVCLQVRQATGIATVVLSGGVFLNALLTREVVAQLADADFRVYRHRLVPPNDGGLSLGQLAVAAASMSQI